MNLALFNCIWCETIFSLSCVVFDLVEIFQILKCQGSLMNQTHWSNPDREGSETWKRWDRNRKHTLMFLLTIIYKWDIKYHKLVFLLVLGQIYRFYFFMHFLLSSTLLGFLFSDECIPLGVGWRQVTVGQSHKEGHCDIDSLGLLLSEVFLMLLIKEKLHWTLNILLYLHHVLWPPGWCSCDVEVRFFWPSSTLRECKYFPN